jgi:hypothetical protein
MGNGTGKRLIFWLIAGLPVAALTAVLIACRHDRERWLPAVAFLAVASAGSLYEVVVLGLKRGRERWGQGRSVPWDVALRKPWWYQEGVTFVWLGAMLGAMAAVIGFPGVGLGLAMPVAALMLASLTLGEMRASRLTFEEGGLRLGSGQVSFLVPWAAISEVERAGRYCVLLTLSETEEALGSVQPDTPDARRRASGLLFDSRIMLEPWIGGVDAHTLARAIEEGGHRRGPGPN